GNKRAKRMSSTQVDPVTYDAARDDDEGIRELEKIRHQPLGNRRLGQFCGHFKHCWGQNGGSTIIDLSRTRKTTCRGSRSEAVPDVLITGCFLHRPSPASTSLVLCKPLPNVILRLSWRTYK